MTPTSPPVQDDAAALLQERGFEVVESGLVESTSCWLRVLAKGSRQMMIHLPRDANADDVIEAIYDAGMKEKNETFAEAVKTVLRLCQIQCR